MGNTNTYAYQQIPDVTEDIELTSHEIQRQRHVEMENEMRRMDEIREWTSKMIDEYRKEVEESEHRFNILRECNPRQAILQLEHAQEYLNRLTGLLQQDLWRGIDRYNLKHKQERVEFHLIMYRSLLPVLELAIKMNQEETLSLN